MMVSRVTRLWEAPAVNKDQVTGFRADHPMLLLKLEPRDRPTERNQVAASQGTLCKEVMGIQDTVPLLDSSLQAMVKLQLWVLAMAEHHTEVHRQQDTHLEVTGKAEATAEHRPLDTVQLRAVQEAMAQIGEQDKEP